LSLKYSSKRSIRRRLQPPKELFERGFVDYVICIGYFSANFTRRQPVIAADGHKGLDTLEFELGVKRLQRRTHSSRRNRSR